jgi:hypothetical protein
LEFMLLEFRNGEVGEITKQNHTNTTPVVDLLDLSYTDSTT